MFLQEAERPKPSVTPDFAGEAVSRARIDLYFVGDAFLLQYSLEMVSLFDRDSTIGLAVKN